MIKTKNTIEKLKYYYRLIKAKHIHYYFILVGILGVAVGLYFSTPLINQIFAWFILIGVFIKLYDFSEHIERDMIPYDFNMLLPPPKKKK